MSGFDPTKSRVSTDALANFLGSPIDEDLTSVPGIGDAAVKLLNEPFENDPPIETTYQLLGKFLSLKGKGMTQQEHCDAMWFYLQERGLNSYRAGIVHCLAERLNLFMPGFYDSSNFMEK